MEIYGKERGFFLSAGAKSDIGELGGNLSGYMQIAACAVILNKWHNVRQRYLGKETPEDLTIEQVLSLEDDVFLKLADVVRKAIEDGSAVSVEVEEDKKKESKA